MTQMVPPLISAVANNGERKMFEAIRNAADSDNYFCLHSVGLARHERKEYSEADFVLVGPPGVFAVETKGGSVARSNGVWTIGWPGKSYTSTEGPFAQAESTQHPLRGHLKDALKLSPSDILVGWGVAFPDITFNEVGPEWDAAVVYDQRDRASSFVKYIERLDAHFRARLADLGRRAPPRLTSSQVMRIVQALRSDFRLVPTLRGLIANSRRELVELSRAQYAVLDCALNEHNPRILCDGGPGTGKTLIAVEAARRLALAGKKVLLLCYNNQLGRFLSADFDGSMQGVEVSTIYRFMSGLIRRGGFGAQLTAQVGSAANLFESVYPTLFELAAAALTEEGALPQYDVIVLDEAQDVINESILNSLDVVLDKGFSAGNWLMLLDSGLQSNVYGRLSSEVLSRLREFHPTELRLSENFRNPKEVASEMSTITGCASPICRRQLSSPVEYVSAADDKEAGRKLRALLVQCLREGVPAGSITVLSGCAVENCTIRQYPPDVGKQIHYLNDTAEPCPQDAICASTISAFKGLENEVVVLTDLPELEGVKPWARSIIYVGMSRARSKLYAIVNKDYLDARSQL